MIAPESEQDVCDAVRAGRVLPSGGRTKPALSTPTDDVEALDMCAITGIVEHNPAELTITARAGTSLSELSGALHREGQHLPFDPPLTAAGATLGGTVAGGTSGSGAFRHGALRDFVIGVRFVDGTGTAIRGGGKVVKNAAGFDLAKLMIGSCGRLGVLTEISLKVFPKPRSTATLVFSIPFLPDAIAAVQRVARSGIDVHALDIEHGRVLVRFGAQADAIDERSARLERCVAAPAQRQTDDTALWRAVSELEWVPDGHAVVRAVAAPALMPALDAVLDGAPARYANAATVAWIAWPAGRDIGVLDARLAELGIPAMRVTGPAGRPLIGARSGGAFAARIRHALDPDRRFAEL